MLTRDRRETGCGAQREYRRAVELSPSYATAHHWYGELLVQMGRFNNAFEQFGRALEKVDPLSPAISSDVCIWWLYAHNFDRAIAELQKSIAANPTFEPHLPLSVRRVCADVGRSPTRWKNTNEAGSGPVTIPPESRQGARHSGPRCGRRGGQGFGGKVAASCARPAPGGWPYDVACCTRNLATGTRRLRRWRRPTPTAFGLLFLKVGPEWDGIREIDDSRRCSDRVDPPVAPTSAGAQ